MKNSSRAYNPDCSVCYKKEKIKILWDYVESELKKEWSEKHPVEDASYPYDCWIYWAMIAHKSRFVTWKRNRTKQLEEISQS